VLRLSFSRSHSIRQCFARRNTVFTVNVASAEVYKGPSSGIGYRFFGGTELMFASFPRLGLSYRKLPVPFAGFEADPLSLTIAGHWYMK
jgi:hypothetical protein